MNKRIENMIVDKIDYPTFLNPSQFAKKLGVSKSTISELIKKGKISVIQIGFAKHNFIDYEKWKDYKFDQSKKRNITSQP